MRVTVSSRHHVATTFDGRRWEVRRRGRNEKVVDIVNNSPMSVSEFLRGLDDKLKPRLVVHNEQG